MFARIASFSLVMALVFGVIIINIETENLYDDNVSQDVVADIRSVLLEDSRTDNLESSNLKIIIGGGRCLAALCEFSR